MIAFYQAMDGDHWANNSGWKTAPLEVDGFAAHGSEGGWFGLEVQVHTVTRLDMPDNHLRGSLPAEMGDLKNIDFLRIKDDGIEGTLPDSMAKLTNLNYLSIVCSRIPGSLPAYFGNFRFLNFLSLSYTPFSGPLPVEICNMVELNCLYIKTAAFVVLSPPVS